MELVVCGLSHHTAPLEVRERWAFSPAQTRRALHEMLQRANGAEHLILSTCNRTEFYSGLASATGAADGHDGPPDLDANGAVRLCEEVRGCVSGGEFETPPAGQVYVYRGDEALEHFFRVAAGIDSMIVGESQILKQIKVAFSVAAETRAAGKFFGRLVPAALRAGKQVRSRTTVGEGCVTPGHAAVKLGREVLGDLSGTTALVVGSGDVADLTGQALRDEVRECFVVNRTAERARALASRVGHGMPLEWKHLDECLAKVDLVISSTSSPEPIVGRERLEAARRQGGFQPLVVVDLAVPRDFAATTRQIPGVHLFDIDDLNGVIEDNVRRRHRQLPAAERIVASAVQAFRRQSLYLEVDPVIRRLVERFEQIRLGELQKSLDDLPPETHAAVDAFSRALVKKLLYFPIEKLKSIRDMRGLGPEEVTFLRRLFLH